MYFIFLLAFFIIEPLSIVYKFAIDLNKVVFPEPFLPTSPII